MKTKERYIDLSDIKDNELDKTASFTDLMSRSQRRQREKEKKKNLEEVFNESENDIDTVHNNSEQENQIEIEEVSNVESTEELLSQTKQYEDLTNTFNNNIEIKNKEKTFKKECNYDVEEVIDDNLEITESFGYRFIIVSAIFLLISTGIFIYSILFTNSLNKNIFLYIDSACLLIMHFFFTISLICKSIVSKVISILIYLLFTGFIIFNVLITMNYIK